MDEIRERIQNTFDSMFPNAHCELNFNNEFELLVAVILSAQSTDVSVNKITKTLFSRYKTPEDFANCQLSDLENEIKKIGLYKNKAKNIQKMSQMLIEKYGSRVPSTFLELIELPGVGRKTANVVLSVVFNTPAFAVDTHVERVSKRLKIAEEKDSVLEVEKKLNNYFDKNQWNKLHHQMIFFGRYHCLARNPKCDECPIKDLCQNEHGLNE